MFRIKRVIYPLLSLVLITGCQAKTVNKTANVDNELPYQATSAAKQNEMRQTLADVANDNQYTLDNPYVKVNPYGISPLSAYIAFNGDPLLTYTITLKSNEDSIADLTYTYTNQSFIHGSVTGLNVEGDTKVIISDGTNYHELTLTADSIPETAIAKAKLTTHQANLDANHLVFVSPSSTGCMSAYDTLGNLRFVLEGMFIWDANVTNDNQLIVSNDTLIELPYYMSGFYTMDLTGHIASQYMVPGGYHHDVDALSNGNYLVASNDINRGTVEDVIVELDGKTGEVVKTFDMQSIIDPNTGKSLNWTTKDWFHNNSVEYDPIDNTLVVSGRHQDVVAIIDYDIQELVGLVGDSTGWDEAYLPYFYTPLGNDFEFQWAQHAASYNDQHQLMLFDNGIFRSKDSQNNVDAKDNYSRFVLYEIDNKNHTIRQVFQYGKERGYAYYSPYICDVDQIDSRQVFQYGKERGYAYYSPYICDVDQIDSNRYLIDSGGISYLNGEINNLPGALTSYDQMEAYITLIDQGECVWEMLLATNIYRAEFIDVNDIQYNGTDFTNYGNMQPINYQTVDSLDLSSVNDVTKTNELGFNIDVNDIQYNGTDFTNYGNMQPINYQTVDSLDLSSVNDVTKTNELGFNLYHDGYRLVVDANVGRKDSLALICVSDDQVRQYDIQNETEVGMCVSIFNETDETNHLIQSVPLTDLNDNYRFYYLYNGQYYDTGYTYS